MKKFTILFSLFLVSSYLFGQNLPVAVNDTANATAGIPITVNLLLNDYDPDGDSIEIWMAMSPNGLITKTDSSITYTPHICYEGLDSIRYWIREKNNYSNRDQAFLVIYVTNNGFEYLETNNIKARINAFGNHFWDFDSKSSFEVPKGKGKNSIFSSTLWAGGLDNSSNLHLAAELYRGNGEDFWVGPIMDSTAYSMYNDSVWSKVWKISKTELDYHWAHWQDVGYVPIPDILSWPGTIPGQQVQFAPYYDNNNNGTYNAYDGDYPLIWGDECIYFVYNDDRKNHTESGGEKLGIEIHAMAYAFDCPTDSAFNNTLFIHYDIYNRSSINYTNTYFGNFTDFEIGYAYDDYVACDVQRGTFFSYNGINIDGTGKFDHYGANPPAQGVTILKGPLMDADGIDNPSGINEGVNGLFFGDGIPDNECLGLTNFVYFTGWSMSPMSDPHYAIDYYNYMNSLWLDSTHILYGGNGHANASPPAYGPACNFMYPGNTDSTNWGTGGVAPNGPVYWSEETAGNTPYDRRGYGSMGPFTFNAGDKETIDLAYVFARDYNDSLAYAAVNVLKTRIDSIISGYKADKSPCGGSFSNINKVPKLQSDLKVFPNPANSELFVAYKNLSKESQYFIFDMFGKLVKTGILKENEINSISIFNLNTGLYILKVLEGSNVKNAKFIKM